MLILTRKAGESIIVGGVVKITTLGLQGKQVRLGITAPREVEVHREEIYQRLQEEKKAGSTAPRPGEKAQMEILVDNDDE